VAETGLATGTPNMRTGGRKVGGVLAAAVVLAAVAGAALAFFLTGGAPERPNIIIICVDTLRSDHVGAYGYPRETTPQMDRIAGEGVLFEECYSNSNWTKPAVASLFTGLYVGQHDVKFAHTELDDGKVGTQRLPEQATTLAEILKGEGYHTIASVENVHISERFGFAQGFDEWNENVRGATSVTNSFLRQLEESDRPFFAYVHYFDPHTPYNPNMFFETSDRIVPETERAAAALERLQETAGGGGSGAPEAGALEAITGAPGAAGRAFAEVAGRDGPGAAASDDGAGEGGAQAAPSAVSGRDAGEGDWSGEDEVDLHPWPVYMFGVDKGLGGLSAFERRRLEALYDGEIRDVDVNLERVVAALRAGGAWENTWIILTADHGENFYENRRVTHPHDCFLNWQVRVPLLMKMPRGSGVGPGRIEARVQHVDVTATVLSYLGLGLERGMVGRDLLPALRGEAALEERDVVAESESGWMILSGARKYTRILTRLGDFEQFCNLAEEPLELSPRRPDEREGEVLSARFEHINDEARSQIFLDVREGVELSPEEEERMRSLGYVH